MLILKKVKYENIMNLFIQKIGHIVAQFVSLVLKCANFLHKDRRSKTCYSFFMVNLTLFALDLGFLQQNFEITVLNRGICTIY